MNISSAGSQTISSDYGAGTVTLAAPADATLNVMAAGSQTDLDLQRQSRPARRFGRWRGG